MSNHQFENSKASPKPVWSLATWFDGINTAPKDREILFYGRWKPFDILEGGERCIVIARWSTLRADGTGQDWMTGLGPVSSWNVNWTHWAYVPAPPDDGLPDPLKKEPLPELPQCEVDAKILNWFLGHPGVTMYPDKLAKELGILSHQVVDAYVLLKEQNIIDANYAYDVSRKHLVTEKWIAENREAIEQWNEYTEKNGLTLAKYRQF